MEMMCWYLMCNLALEIFALSGVYSWSLLGMEAAAWHLVGAVGGPAQIHRQAN